MSSDKFSYTSNTAKLLKHLDTLKGLAAGKVSPIMVHTMPTHRCQLKCAHCCFRNRANITMDLDPDLYMSTMQRFHSLGVRAMELTGGGEPTLYPHINECLEYFLDDLGMHVGLITNGLSAENIEARLFKRLSWVRVSLNSLDYVGETDFGKKFSRTLFLLDKRRVSFCYIWNRFSEKNIERVVDFVEQHEIVCRVSPDCIQPAKAIEAEMAHVRTRLAEFKTEGCFLSDFNTTLTRRNSNCYIHLIKPALYTDGYVYPCPSGELAVENSMQINPQMRLCHGSEVYRFYSGLVPGPMTHNCSYCKYSKQQDLLEDLLTETDFNEFA